MTKYLKKYALITLGATIYALAYNAFFANGSVAFGGVTGIAQMLHALVPALPVGGLVIAFNIPLFLLGWKFFGGGMLAASLFAMGLSSTLLDMMGKYLTFPVLSDTLLSALCGGVAIGVGLGLIFLQGATTGGTEIVAKLLKLRLSYLPTGKLLMAVDLAVIAGVSLVFRSLETALYGVVASYVSTRVMDMVLYGLDTAKVAYIISDHPQEIARVIMNELSRGVTYLQGEGGYTGETKRVILCTFKDREIVSVKEAVRRADPHAFMIVTSTHEVLGEGFGGYQQGV